MPTYAKAIVAALIGALSFLAGAITGDAGFADVTFAQWIGTALAALVAGGSVYGVPNGYSTSSRTSTPGPVR